MGFIRTFSSLVKKKKNNSVLEVDFDSNPSALMSAIVECDWETVVNLCRNDPNQAEIWNHRFAEADVEGASKKLAWRVLPVHAAITYQAPVEAFVAILAAYPAGAKLADDKGRLPLHLAFKHDANDEILSALAEEYPEGFNDKDDQENTPLDLSPEDSPRNWIEDMKAAHEILRTERLQIEILTLEETVAELKETIHDYDMLLTKSSDSIEMDYDLLHGSVRVTEKFRVVSPS